MSKVTKEILLKGINYRKTIQVKALMGGEVTIKPLNDSQMTSIYEALNIKMDDERLKEGSDVDIKAFLSSMTLAQSHKMMIEACKYGIDPIESPDVYNLASQLGFGVADEIGSEIIEISMAMPQEVQDFIKAQLANPSQQPTPQAIILQT